MSNNSVLSGDLNFLGLGDILQLLGSNGSSGILNLQCKYAPDPGVIYMVEGNPINATNGTLSGLDAIYPLFGWADATFEFDQSTVNCETTIKTNRMNIILDSLSMLDEGSIEVLGPVSFDEGPSEKMTLPSIRGPLVDYMYVVDEEEFADGQKITVEGQHGNWIWVIMEGTIDIYKNTDQGDVKLLKLASGSFLGSAASFLISGNVRGASAVADGPVQLGILDSQRLASEFAQLMTPFRGLLIGLDRRLRHATDHAVDIHFKQNNAKELMADKKAIIKQGSDEDRILSLTSGEACVIRKTKYGNVPLAKLAPGDVFGRIPFLDFGHEPGSASVYGTEDMKVKSLDLDDLQKDYEKLSSTFKNMIDNLTTCLAVTTKLACNFQKTMIGDKPKKS
jgi:CRP-like cAMP-binding protein